MKNSEFRKTEFSHPAQLLLRPSSLHAFILTLPGTLFSERFDKAYIRMLRKQKRQPSCPSSFVENTPKCRFLYFDA